MNQPPKKSYKKPNAYSQEKKTDVKKENSHNMNPESEILAAIQKLETQKKTLKDYPIRELVKHAEKLGPELKKQRLETNQIRKFLDAINRIKASFDDDNFSAMETQIVLLKPKLAYAAARQSAVKSLSKVMSAAIDKVHSKEDFERLVQLIESIIAYHKEKEGK